MDRRRHIVVLLSRPLNVWGKTRTQLLFSQPKFADMKVIFRGRNEVELNLTADTVFKLLSRCSGLPRRVLEGLDVADFRKCLDVLFDEFLKTQDKEPPHGRD